MLRGSSFLLERSYKFYENLIEVIATLDQRIWTIDVMDYDDPTCRALLLDCKHQIFHALGRRNMPSDVLITKIMLGVFGNVPAFDQYFRKGFKLSNLTDKSLLKIHNYYTSCKNEIDTIDIKTLDFNTGFETKRKYTKAKIIDMIGFIEGQK